MDVKVNKRSLSTKLNSLDVIFQKKTKSRLKVIAGELANYAPVVTGAYAESFSVGPKSRSRTSRNRPKTREVGKFRQIAYDTMAADIEGLQLQSTKRIPFRNRAPHARYIEGVYQVFGKAKDRNR